MCFDEIVCPKGQEFLVKERIDVRNTAGRIVRGFREEPVWKSIKNIAKGDYLCVAINNKSELPKWDGSYYNQFGHHRLLNTLSPLFEQPEFWYIMGRYVGDGWTRRTYNKGDSYRGGIVICCSKKKVKDYDTLKEAFDKCGFKVTITEERTVYKMSFYSVEIYDFVQRYSKGALYKVIDGETLSLPVELLSEFMRGYRDSDGSFTQDKFKLTSVSRNLIYSAGQCVAKAYKTHYHTYHSPMPKTCIIEGRKVKCHDQYQLVWDTNVEKTFKAFYENGHIWFPISKCSRSYKNVTLYELTMEDGGYNAFSVVTR